MSTPHQWSSASDVLRYMAENIPFEPEWPDGTHDIAVTATMPDGDTPLHFACAWGDLKAVELLVLAGAPIDKMGDMSITPLGTAVSGGHVEIAAFLLKHGASPFAQSEFGATPYQQASNGSAAMRAIFSA